MKRIAIFASGQGTNAENIARFFHDSDIATVSLIVTNKKDAGVVEKAHKLGIRCIVVSPKELSADTFMETLKTQKISFIVLAGFLKQLPARLLEAYDRAVINVHPSLLPDYGGAGMYGMHVHRAVVENEDEESGISIHYVSEGYDEGEIVFQESVEIDFEDTPEDVQYKVQQLEYKHYPEVIEYLLRDLD
jgi:phosphoribosylglycinamide formyltransferase-1